MSISLQQQFSIELKWMELSLWSIISVIMWFLTGIMLFLITIESPPRVPEAPSARVMTFPLRNKARQPPGHETTTIGDTETTDGSLAVVTTTVIKPGISSQGGLLAVQESECIRHAPAIRWL